MLLLAFNLIQGLFVLDCSSIELSHTLDVDLGCVLKNSLGVSQQNLLAIEY